ncbi:MAG: 2-C-methyl-D-erythritol 4-phosphate cytidylyltransferase [Rhodothermia bacterium]|nr:MAG: 2-C-methyl-D-erythritol 4-phosphate cytidylyltransferase [Rhodothermia bacterium]
MDDRTSRGTEVAVLIPAAGEGTRLGGRRKQFRVLGGKPMLVQTLDVFERHPEVDHIIVATPAEAVRPLRQELRRIGITKLMTVVSGGLTRQDSVAAALAETPDTVEVVLVHDAVRPFVRLSQVSAVIKAAREQGAGALAVPVTDTIRKGEDELFGETVPREKLYRMQTPQGFRRTWFQEAHAESVEKGFHSTDDVDLIQQKGLPVQIVPGGELNVKITTPEDWERATQFWPMWEKILHLEEREREVMTEAK